MGATGSRGGGGVKASGRGATTARYTRQPGGTGNRRAVLRREQETQNTRTQVRRRRNNVRNTGQ